MNTNDGPQWSPDGQWWWDGQQWRPRAEYGAPTPQPPTRPRRTRWPWFAGSVVMALVLLTVFFAAIGNAGQGTPHKTAGSSGIITAAATPTAIPPTPTPATPAPATPAPAPRVLLDQAGTGTGETNPFDTPSSHFKVTYSFSGNDLMGNAGNFILTPIDANGNALAGPEANRLATEGSGTADGYTLGAEKGMRLQVITYGSWHVTVTTAS